MLYELRHTAENSARLKAYAKMLEGVPSTPALSHLAKATEDIAKVAPFGKPLENVGEIKALVELVLADPSKLLVLYGTSAYFASDNESGGKCDMVMMTASGIYAPFVKTGGSYSAEIEWLSTLPEGSNSSSAVNMLLHDLDLLSCSSALRRGILPVVLDTKTANVVIYSPEVPDGIPGFQVVGEYSSTTENAVSNNSTTKQENKIMANVKSTATAVVSKNKAAALSVAKLEAGRIAIKQVSKVVTPKLPIMVRGYADTAIGRLVIANLFNFAVTQFAQGNKNATLVADAMLEGAMLEALQSFNVEQLIADVVGKVDISKLVDASAEE